MVIAPRPKSISGEAATRVSTSRLCPRRPFQETRYPVTRLLRTALPNTPAGRLASELQTDARLLGVTSPGLPWACEVSSCSADQGAAAVTVADTQSKHALGQRPLQSE